MLTAYIRHDLLGCNQPGVHRVSMIQYICIQIHRVMMVGMHGMLSVPLNITIVSRLLRLRDDFEIPVVSAMKFARSLYLSSKVM